MTQAIDQRISAALSDGSRAATVAALIAEIDAMMAQSKEECQTFDSLAQSASTPESAADDAAVQSAKLRARIIRLGAKRETLVARHDQLMNSGRRQQTIAAYSEAEARRDQIVADLRSGAVIDDVMLARLAENDSECRRFSRKRQYGLPPLKTALELA